MKAKALPTQAQIKERLHYDPETGIFRWRYSPMSRIKPWDIAGCKGPNGYWEIRISYKLHLAHRLAWVYMNGEWPQEKIDHEDRVRSNNAWANLRAASDKQNAENQSLRKDNASGFRGVSWSKKHKKWRADVVHNGKQIHVGLFSKVEDAALASSIKRDEIFTHNTS